MIFSAHELIVYSQLALSEVELIKIAVRYNCPILAENEARDIGYYCENNIGKLISNNKQGKIGAESVFYLTMLKRYFPEIFWGLINCRS